MDRELVARWVSRSGKHWVELYRDRYGYGYRGPDCGGSLGPDGAAATLELERRIAAGDFQPDANKTPMRREAVGAST